MFTLLKALILTFWSFVQMFLFCETSELIGIQFEKIDFYCQCDWYLYPIEVQRILPYMIQNNQKLTILYGYGNIAFKRETFKNVNQFDKLTPLLKSMTFVVFFFLEFSFS